MSGNKSSALISAQKKLKEKDFDEIDLPNVREDSIWKEIQIECNLTLQELSALKNLNCKLKTFEITIFN